MRKPAAPPQLKPAGRGRRFWRATVTRCELTDAELQLLAEACSTLDLIDTLTDVLKRDGPIAAGSKGQPVASPAVQEVRLQRHLLAKLVSCLALPDPEDEEPARPGGWTTPAATGRLAALRRWHG
jgi:hypothetical protein